MQVRYFNTAVTKFIEKLNDEAVVKVARTIDLLERFGYQLGMPHSKSVAPRLFELRVHGQQEVRLMYAFHKGEAMILHGFVKKTQRTPNKELRQALTNLRLLDSI